MKYNIKDKVVHTPTDKTCIIVATKEQPWKKDNDVFGRKEVYPNNDYVVLIHKDTDDNGNENYLGDMDVFEHDLRPI